MSPRVFIKLGFTFDYFVPAVLLIIIGGISYLGDFIIATFIVMFGITLLLLRTGIEIDIDRKRVRKYYDLFSLRLGMWISVAYSTKVELRRTNESQTMQSRGGQTTYETKTYDIFLVDKNGSSKELNDFQNYDIAVQTLNFISATFSLEKENEVEEIRRAALKWRKDKNYRR